MLHIETGTANPLLRKISQPVRIITKDIKRLLKKMEEAMLDENGIGLAAPQVGVHMRVILVTIFKTIMTEKGPELEEDRILPMINPEITTHSSQKEMGEEGCLSIPGYFDQIERSSEIEVSYMDMNGKAQKIRLDGLNAREVQHEIDHLNGVLFTDYLPEETIQKAQRVMEKKLLEKAHK